MTATPRLTLVLGGQRSGKSRTGEALVTRSGRRPVYVATATAGDGEMAERIARHRARRGADWRTVEEALDLAAAINAAAGPDTAVLVDCLTLWVSNLLHARGSVVAEADRLLVTLKDMAVDAHVVVVSNDVGGGIIPDNGLARRFADELGMLNQRVAAAADEVILVAAGLPLFLKRAGAEA